MEHARADRWSACPDSLVSDVINRIQKGETFPLLKSDIVGANFVPTSRGVNDEHPGNFPECPNLRFPSFLGYVIYIERIIRTGKMRKLLKLTTSFRADSNEVP
ncbi:MAG: hypothetical protein QGG53_43455 [Planctomycetota bacterium]|jgi:hypothetical protein|nr:hypothetical protein [Planctomycetota bacterium]